MKKLFTMIALLAVFLGAKAEWVEDYKIDYSTYQGFPFYVMGYVPEWVDGVMTDLGANFKYVTLDNEAGETSDVTVKTQAGAEYYRISLAEPGWHQYFIADGIPTELDGSYTVKAMVKASESVTINVNMGWGWGDGQQASASVSIGTEWTEVEWEYSGIGGTSCNLVAQPGTATATIEWKSLTVSHNQKPQRPTVWQEWLTSDGQPVIVETTSADIPTYMGNAETPWGDLAETKFNDQTKNFLVCAWGKEKGVNMNDNGGWDPFPATIEEVDGSHVFVVHGKTADTEGDASQWDNQFWIQSPKEWKSGEQLKIHFRYKASEAAKANTQIHHQNPSDYLIWHAVGDINFTTEWQEFDGTMTMADDMAGGWSIAFNLNAENKNAIDFYFDDLSWQSMKLDEGYFVAGANPNEGLEYDFDNAVQFEEDADAGCLTATIGEKNAYVSQVMISTVRGNDAAFKGATLKPAGAIVNDPDNWMDYTPSSLAKLNLPGSGIWKIYIDTEYKSMAFEMLEGTEIKPVEINPNPTEIVVHGQERDWLGANDDGTPKEDEIGAGQTWDNQFFIKANRALATGEVTVISFKYKASREAKTTTQLHGEPGAYKHWAAIGDVNFTTEWQDFEKTLTVPAEANEMLSIAFNMAEIKAACDYEIKDVIWKLEDGTESLIDQTGSKNFFVKEGAGTAPYQFGASTVVAGDANGDGTVNAADIVEIVNYIMGSPSEKFNEANADANGDGTVNAADIVAVVNMIMGNEGAEARSAKIAKAEAEGYSANDVTIEAGGKATLTIDLANAEAYTSATIDLQLPAGVSIAQVMNEDDEMVPDVTSERTKSKHAIEVKLMDTANNIYRIMTYASNNATFKTSGAMFIVGLEASASAASGTGKIIADGEANGTKTQVLVAPDGTQTFVKDVEFQVVVGGTGINNFKADIDNAPVYNLNGQRVVKASKGLFIKNGKKMIMK